MKAYVLKSKQGFATGPVMPGFYEKELCGATLYSSIAAAEKDQELEDEIIEVTIIEGEMEEEETFKMSGQKIYRKPSKKTVSRKRKSMKDRMNR